MRELSDKENEWVDIFSKKGIPFELIHVTETGLGKSILDSTKNVRDFLATNDFHDFKTQGFGPENKVTLPVQFKGRGGGTLTSMSLYRSGSRGDRRLWIAALNEEAMGNDLVALTSNNGKLLAINISQVHANIKSNQGQPEQEMGSVMENEFLEYLLTLQQDGSGAISAPSNWGERPRLYIDTALDESLNKSFGDMLNGDSSGRVAPWHFFVGSPGNGKSAAVGNLIRSFQEKGFEVLDDNGLDIKQIDQDEIPRIVKVCDPSKKCVPLRIAQDASVVKDPFGGKADPATDFIEIVDKAINDRVALLVCANRGVLENASRIVSSDPNKRSDPVWEKLIKQEKGSASFGGEKDGKCSEAKLTFCNLDNRSLLIDSNEFKELLTLSVSRQNWERCSSCSSNQYCPFINNRNWLEKAPDQLVALLRRTEVLSGQVIVFREATALISFFLAGCPLDYEGGMSPCEWVHNRVEGSDYFSLLGRRIYMALFSAYSPLGLEYDKELRREQRTALIEVASRSNNELLNDSVKALGVDEALSSSVGVERMLGLDGFFRRLDCLNEELGEQFVETWDYRINDEFKSNELISDLERKCLEIWDALEKEIEKDSNSSVERYAFLRRWMTAFTYRIGALIECKTLFSSELDAFIQILTTKSHEFDESHLNNLRSVEAQLKEIIAPQDDIQLSEYVMLGGSWASNNLQPSIETNESAKSLELPIKIGGGDKEYTVWLGAEAFVWLMHKIKHGLSSMTFPHDMLMAIRDMRVRAAASSGYAYIDDNVYLKVDVGDGSSILLERIRGGVIAKRIANDQANKDGN